MAGFNITVAGDSAINLEFGNVISEKTNGLIRAAAQTLEADPINGVIEFVPTFCSLMVVYDPCVVGTTSSPAKFAESCAASWPPRAASTAW